MLVTVCHWPVLSAGALSFDDHQYLAQNPLVQRPCWDSVRRFFGEVLSPSTVRGYYQPLAMTSLMIDWARGARADNLQPLHQTSLLLHACNTALVVLLLYVLFGEPWAAALAGLLWGVHPLTVETVAWVAERKTQLSTLFALGCLVCYVRYAQGGRRRWFGLCFASLVLALLSKPTSTPLPLLLVLLDYWPLRRLSWRTVLEKWPLYIVAGAAAVITVISQERAGAIIAPGAPAAAQAPLVVCHNIVFYLGKAIWPAHVGGHYAFPAPLSPAHPAILIGLLGTGAVLAALIVSWRWTRALVVGWLFFFVAVLPTLGIIGFTNVIAADRFMYLPIVGFLLILVWALRRLVRRRAGWVGATVAVGLCASLATASTRVHLSYWRDSVSLYEHMIRVDPRSAPPYYNLGLVLAERGDLAAAAERFAAALAANPRHDAAQRELGFTLEKLGRTAEAIPHFEEALRINPRFVAAHVNLGLALLKQNRADDAMRHFQTAVELDPNDCDAQLGIGLAFKKQGRWEDALRHFEKARALAPDNYHVHHHLAGLWVARGDYPAAVPHMQRAAALRPNASDVQYVLGVTLLRAGRPDDARAAFEAALRLNPNDVEARQELLRLPPK